MGSQDNERATVADSSSSEDFIKHKAAADRILSCERRNYPGILGVEEPVDEAKVDEAFALLSNLLSPQCNLKLYDRAEEAHDSESMTILKN